MPILVADTNSLEHPGLKGYLAASRGNLVAISDMTLVELRKTSALRTSRASLAIVSLFPHQVFALRRTFEMLEEDVRSADDADRLIDYGATAELAAHMRRLTTIPAPPGLAEEMAGLEEQAKSMIALLTAEVATFEPALISAAEELTPAELRQIRTLMGVTDKTRQKLLKLLKETTGQFIRDHQDPGRRGTMLLKDTVGMFAFRYSLCMLLHFMEWVRVGGAANKKLARRVNDVVDMQVVAMGTFFDGVLSRDKEQQTISNTARGILRGFGAYVGDDWSATAGA